NAAIEPTNPFRIASQKMLGFVSTRRQKSGAVGDGPQSMRFIRPASAAVWNIDHRPPSIWVTRNATVSAPPRRKVLAWKTLVHTTAFTPPSAMYAMDTTVKSTMVAGKDQPTSTATATEAAMSRTPDPKRRVMKKKIEPVTWLERPKRYSRNS